MDISLKHEFNTFTLVKRLGIAIFLCTHFFGLTQSFRIFDHAIVHFRKKGKNFLFFDKNTLLWQIWSKKQNFQFKLKLNT